MSGVHSYVVGHLVRRGVEAAQSHFSAPVGDAQYIEKLEADAQLYEDLGQEVNPMELLPVLVTSLIIFLVMASIKYTLGEVMATLAMVESPTAIAVVEERPPPYGDDPDAPIEKKDAALPLDMEADVDVTLLPNKPVTASVRATLRHLHSVGGFYAKWRGARASILYHFMHAIATHILSSLLGFGFVGHAVIYILVSVTLSRFHMVWTHAMIAYPSNKSICRRMVPRRQCKALLIPSFVLAVAQQMMFIVPVAASFAVGSLDDQRQAIARAIDQENCSALLLVILRFLAVPATTIFVALTFLLPATATLARIEAVLLAESEEVIVPFDRAAILGDVDLTARGSSKKLFLAAWRSFDGASRWRLIKVYFKLCAVYFFVVLAGIHVILAEVYLLGAERITFFVKSAGAQLQLMAIEAHKAQQNAD